MDPSASMIHGWMTKPGSGLPFSSEPYEDEDWILSTGTSNGLEDMVDGPPSRELGDGILRPRSRTELRACPQSWDYQ